MSGPLTPYATSKLSGATSPHAERRLAPGAVMTLADHGCGSMMPRLAVISGCSTQVSLLSLICPPLLLSSLFLSSLSSSVVSLLFHSYLFSLPSSLCSLLSLLSSSLITLLSSSVYHTSCLSLLSSLSLFRSDGGTVPALARMRRLNCIMVVMLIIIRMEMA